MKDVDFVNEMKKKALKWCIEEEIFEKEIIDKKSHFHYQLTFPAKSPMKIEVISPIERKDLMVLASKTIVSPETAKNIRNVKDIKILQNFIYELGMLLVDYPIQFDIHHPNNILEYFEIQYLIYSDGGLNKDNFMKGISVVHRSKVKAIWKINFNYGPKHKDESGVAKL